MRGSTLVFVLRSDAGTGGSSAVSSDGMGRTSELRREIKMRFVPLAAASGFALSEAHAPGFLEFRRVVGDGEHLFDVQWEKYGRPRFVVNFSSDGKHGRLQPRAGAGTSSWFRQDATLLDRLLFRPSLRPSSEVVDELISLFPELEGFFSQQVLGKHMHLFPWPAV